MVLNSSKHCRRLEMWSNSQFERIWRHWMLIFKRHWQSTIVRSVQPLPPLLCFCLCYNVPSQRDWIWNWSFIGQLPYQAKDHWWLIKASNDSFWCAGNFTSLSHLYIKEWRLRDWYQTQQQFTSAKTLLKLFWIQSSLKISVSKF
jgi:hypothetical protein